MSQAVDDARKAVEIARDYATRSMGALFWRDVLECEVVKETNEWRVVFVASPSILAPYYRYEVFIDSKTGRVTRAKKSLQWRSTLLKSSGMLPETEEGLLEVPAVGDYIADALSVFAYGRDKVVVDTNVVRIVERLFCVKSRSEGRRDHRIRQFANSMLVPGKSREFNWALIDFRALVCRPANSLCGSCPLSDLCRCKRQAALLG